MAHTVVTVDKHMVRGYVHKHSLQSPACTIVSLVCFIAASLVFCYAQMSTEWQIEPQCVGGLTDSEHHYGIYGYKTKGEESTHSYTDETKYKENDNRMLMKYLCLACDGLMALGVVLLILNVYQKGRRSIALVAVLLMFVIGGLGAFIAVKGMKMLKPQKTSFYCPNSKDYYGMSVYIMGGSAGSFLVSAIMLIIALATYSL